MAEQKSPERIEFYSVTLNAWYTTALEHDKSLLTLSAGGIGLLITLLSTVGIDNFLVLLLYVFAILFFIICLISVLLILNGNREHLSNLIDHDSDAILDDPYLRMLDKFAIYSFIIGVVFSSIIGISTAYQQFVKKESDMADEKIKSTVGIAMDSYLGAQAFQKSFVGAQSFKPPVANNTSNTATAQTNATQQATAQQTAASASAATTSQSNKK